MLEDEKLVRLYSAVQRRHTLHRSTDDVQRRLAVHNSGKGAKYTRGRLPVEVVYAEACESYSAALKREYAIKQLNRQEKLNMIEKQNIPEG